MRYPLYGSTVEIAALAWFENAQFAGKPTAASLNISRCGLK